MSEVRPKRLLAVDYGDRRTGLAATDWTGTICVPLDRIDESDARQLADRIVAVARERETECIVLGVPLLRSGDPGERARRTLAFRELLARAAAPIPVVTVDESHSTDEAHERLKGGGMRAARRKSRADSIAALVILERYRQLMG